MAGAGEWHRGPPPPSQHPYYYGMQGPNAPPPPPTHEYDRERDRAVRGTPNRVPPGLSGRQGHPPASPYRGGPPPPYPHSPYPLAYYGPAIGRPYDYWYNEPPVPHRSGPPGWYRSDSSEKGNFPPSMWPEPPVDSRLPPQDRAVVTREARDAAQSTPTSNDEEEDDDKNDKNETREKKRDPLSLLAKVSSTMEPPANREAPLDDAAAPQPQSSLVRGGPRVSPITSPRSGKSQPPKPITPTTSYYTPDSGAEYPRARRPMLPPPSTRGSFPPMPQHRPPPPGAYHEYPPPYSYREWGEPSPALVERTSFDSYESVPYDARFGPYYYPDAYDYSYGPGPPPPPPNQPRGEKLPYPPPRWTEPSYGRSEVPRRYAPYTYVQQPALDEKTVLRKKFSWKHYPELERFLIAHRDEYLRHSSKNYTLEQKQYNNWLTDRLIKVAETSNYYFDPEEFNFVSIRDRIRCYYKSYVQTARKRGLPVPNSGPNLPSGKLAKVGDKNAEGGLVDDKESAGEDAKITEEDEGTEVEAAEATDVVPNKPKDAPTKVDDLSGAVNDERMEAAPAADD